MQANPSIDLPRITFQLLALFALIATCFWILQPFLVAFVWAATIAVALWPVLLHVQGWLGGRRSLAVAAMTIALLLTLVVPLYMGIATIVENAERVAGWSKALEEAAVPEPPVWLESIPMVGPGFATRWRQIGAAGPEGMLPRLAPYARDVGLWFVGRVGSVGLLLVQFVLTVIIAAILFSNGETASRGVCRFAQRLAGAQGEDAIHLAGQAVRAVALGVVVTAIVQSALAGVGLAVVGVPFATILTAVMFVLAVAQIGPMPVMLPAVIWVYATSGGLWGTGFLVWAIFAGTIDSFLRPALIKRGADLPLLLIFAGVIGGLIAFGIIGLFIGPVVLAVAYTLLVAWMSGSPAGA